jgi:ABC-type multidrug transport system ATPase subunit
VLDRPAVVGYAPERFPVQPFSARDYLRAMANVRGIPRTVIGEWAEHLAFSDLLNVRLAELSKGSLHKVGLIQALLATATTPSCLLLFDEPFAGLDATTRSDLPGLLRRLAAEGATVIVSDHEGDLRKLDDIAHWNVHDHHVTLGEAAPTVAVLRVVVPVDDADEVSAKLRAEGYRVEDER